KGFMPGWDPGIESGALSALIDIAGHYDDLVQTSLNDAHDKARLASLDAMGAVLRPAAPARSVVVFTADNSGAHDTLIVRQGTIRTATADGQTIPFETDHDVALIAAKMDQVLSVRNGIAKDLLANNEKVHPRNFIYIGLKYALFPGTKLTLTVEL